ncbi:DUF6660 family protein [Mesonia maritima]|uniref:Uncharacterized protein n=1 Tax=Mesonia maritima TaxID=1793873 RepID=A0ABU1K3T7_9FLAO|nr:DUF6660 family protein [Mesonia maritima]MDR6300266.1 hypothetical protein [Mesonia maritima]
MKLLTILFSFYFLGLAVIPCSDSDSQETDTVSVVSENNNHHSSAADLCTPFCQCHCCHVHMLNFAPISFEVLAPEISKEETLHFNNSGIDFSQELLQPPRV